MRKQKGFIALISAIIISAILILVSTVASFRSFFGRSNILDAELKEQSVAMAEACADQALLEIANDPSYSGNATTTLAGSYECYIGSIPAPSGGQIIFKTRSYYRDFYTNLKIVINTSDLSIVSWEEISNF